MLVLSREVGESVVIGSEAQLEFEPRKDNPFGYLQSTAKQGDLLITAQRRDYSAEKKGKLYPQRVVTVASFGRGKGYQHDHTR